MGFGTFPVARGFIPAGLRSSPNAINTIYLMYRGVWI